MFDLPEQRDGIFAGQQGVGGIVLHAKVRRIDPAQYLEKYFRPLRELGVNPIIILVVVLHTERNVARGGIFHALLDADNHPLHTLLAGHIRPALPRKDAAEFATLGGRGIDHCLFALDFLPATWLPWHGEI